VVSLTQSRATKKAVGDAAEKCGYLHLSTHGFFAAPQMMSDQTDSTQSVNSNAGPLAGTTGVNGLDPGLLSGLALAGANRPFADGKDDGILTSLEVADLDLGHVELATLSACETGLGQSAGGEGLLGLQRAFQTAGAKTVVASLWKVSDKATQLLMSRFYDNLWHKKMSKVEALREAQRWLLHEGPKQAELVRGLDFLPVPEGASSHSAGLSPRFWAAFVLSGDWR
jgi:CHAT domain-containing protein